MYNYMTIIKFLKDYKFENGDMIQEGIGGMKPGQCWSEERKRESDGTTF